MACQLCRRPCNRTSTRAFPDDVCLVGTVLPNGFAQITPRGSTLVFDDEPFLAVGARKGFDGR